jgi:hypothetical protein
MGNGPKTTFQMVNAHKRLLCFIFILLYLLPSHVHVPMCPCVQAPLWQSKRFFEVLWGTNMMAFHAHDVTSHLILHSSTPVVVVVSVWVCTYFAATHRNFVRRSGSCSREIHVRVRIPDVPVCDLSFFGSHLQKDETTHPLPITQKGKGHYFII